MGILVGTNMCSKSSSPDCPASCNWQDNRPAGASRSKVMELLGAFSTEERRQVDALLDKPGLWDESDTSFAEDFSHSKEDNSSNNEAVGLPHTHCRAEPKISRPSCIERTLKNDVSKPQPMSSPKPFLPSLGCLLPGEGGFMDLTVDTNIVQKLAMMRDKMKKLKSLGLADNLHFWERADWRAKSPRPCPLLCQVKKGDRSRGAKHVGIFPLQASPHFEKHYLPSPQNRIPRDVKLPVHPLPQPPLSRTRSSEQSHACFSAANNSPPRHAPYKISSQHRTSSKSWAINPSVFCVGAPQITPTSFYIHSNVNSTESPLLQVPKEAPSVEQGKLLSKGPAIKISPPPPTPKCPCKWTRGVVLGQGIFGVVYEGLNLEDGSFFAVKISNTEDACLEIKQEIDVLSKLKHPNIVRYFGSSIENGHLCIFLELMRMGSLETLLQKYKHFEDNTIRSYTRQMLLGLEYLHANKTIHRDIKCANILVDVDGQVKLADFGVAKQMDDSLTSSLKGTPLYMAPEVLTPSKQCYSFSADVWSLGCTVLEMADGRPPWSNLEGFGFLFKVRKGELPPIPEHLSPEGRDFVSKCLKLNPKDRPTATELLQHPFVKIPSPAAEYFLSQVPAASMPICNSETSLFPSLKRWQC